MVSTKKKRSEYYDDDNRDFGIAIYPLVFWWLGSTNVYQVYSSSSSICLWWYSITDTIISQGSNKT